MCFSFRQTNGVALDSEHSGTVLSTVALDLGTALPKMAWDALDSITVSAGLEYSAPGSFGTRWT